MKRVVFKRVTIQNFLSVGDEPLELPLQNGVTLITGHNYDKDSRNGVGKSAIFTDALFFAMFGSAMRRIGKSKLPNRKALGRPKVEVEFDVVTPTHTDAYLLTRMMKPARLYLSKNGDDVSRTIAKSTTEIQSIIDASPDVFRNCVIMAVNQTKPFMSQARPEKRRFIEGIFGMDIFSSMLLEARRQSNELGREIDRASSIKAERENTKKDLESQQSRQRTERAAQIVELQRRIEINNAEIARIVEEEQTDITPVDEQTTTENITKLCKQISRSSNTIEQLIAQQAKLSERVRSRRQELDDTTDTPDVCPQCKRPWDPTEACTTDHVSDIENKQRELNEFEQLLCETQKQLAKHVDLKNRCSTAMTKLEKQLAAWRRHQDAVAHATEKKLPLVSFNETIAKDIQALKQQGDSFKELIDKANSALNEVQGQINQLQTLLTVLEHSKFVVSEEGVKSYIIRKVLQSFNKCLAYYLQRFNAPCNCSFNEYFEEMITAEDGSEAEYESFSAGEKKRIDLAMLFTFQDIRRQQSDTSVNISVYDELFDSSLDSAGVTQVLELLKERADKFGECTYVITHRTDSAKLTDGVSLVHLEKRSGITTIAHTETSG